MAYGTRYLSLSKFIRYCETLKIKTSREELEHYEREKIMFPMIRTVKPVEYLKQEVEWELSGNYDLPIPTHPDSDQLYDRTDNNFTDEELVDSFDRQIGNNPYISRPSETNFQPWDTYEVKIQTKEGHVRTRSRVEHHYSYWQAHQLYFIQQSPDLYKNRHLISTLKCKGDNLEYYPRSFSKNVYVSYRSMAHFYDSLSFFITMVDREKERTFSGAQEINGYQTLSSEQHNELLDQLSNHAKLVQERFSLNPDNLFNFLIFLLETYMSYQENEKFRLSTEIKSDIIYQAQLIWGVTGQEWKEIAIELGRRQPFQIKKAFEHLDLIARARDAAKDVLNGFYKSNIVDLQEIGIEDDDINRILDFCDENDLYILFYSLDDLVIEGEEGWKFTKKNKYTSMKNLSTSLEYFLKAIRKSDNSNLNSLIKKAMKNESWISGFKERKTVADNKHFHPNLTYISGLQNKQLRHFLTASLSRNMVVHNFVFDDWFYGDIYRTIYESLLYCIFYSWHVAKKENWV